MTYAAETPLMLEATIRLPKISGRIDHMAIDPSRNRLLVAELGNDSVDVVDLAAGKVVGRIVGLAEPQGIGYLPKPDIIAVANAHDGTLRFFRGSDFAAKGQIALGRDADNVRVAPEGNLVVGFGDGALAVIDGASLAKTREIPLAAHPESFQIDPVANRAYVNVPDNQEIAVVDLTARKQIASWKLGDLEANFPMALDKANGWVLAVTRSPPRLVAFDARSGAIVARMETCGDADDLFVDGRRAQYYVSCGAGAVDVLARATDGIHRLGRVPTSSGARTSFWSEPRDRLYVAAPAGLLGSDASLLVLRPSP